MRWGVSPGCSPTGTLSHDMTAGSPEAIRMAWRRMRADMAFFFIVRIVCLLLLLAVAVLQFVRLYWGVSLSSPDVRRLSCGWLSGYLSGGRRSAKAVPVVYSRFAALCGTFPLPTLSEGVGFSAVFATPSEGVMGNVRTSGMRHGVLSGCPGHRGGNLRAAVTDSRCQ